MINTVWGGASAADHQDDPDRGDHDVHRQRQAAVVDRVVVVHHGLADVTGGGAVTGARDLLDPLLADVSANSTDQVPTLRGVPLLVRAIAGGDADLAAEAALIHQHHGHTGAELAAWEEAAVAARGTDL